MPPSTRELSRDSKVSVQVANGDHCDFKAERTFETTLTKEEIMDYYKDASIQSAKGISKVKIKVILKEAEHGKLIYRIVALNDGYSANFDIRCM